MQIGRGLALSLKLGRYVPRLNQNNNIINNSIINLVRKQYDKMEISQNARALYLNSIERENSKVNLTRTDIKIETQNSKSEYKDLEEEFIKMSSKYRGSINKIKESDLSDKDKSKRIEALEDSYAKEMETSIDEIADEFNKYFETGQELLQVYSKDELEDIFDEDSFKKNFKSKALELRDTMLNSPSSKGTEQIYKSMSNKSGYDSEPEEITFKEIHIINKVINGKYDDVKLKVDDEFALSTNIAMEENNKNEIIDSLDISDKVKTSMYRVNRRVSEGQMRDVTYQEELEKHLEKVKAFDENLDRISKKINWINKVVEERKDIFGVSPKNKLLLNSLKDESKIVSDYNGVKRKKEELIKSFQKLKSSKHNIVGFDSYKRMKINYDKLKESMEDDDDFEDKKVLNTEESVY